MRGNPVEFCTKPAVSMPGTSGVVTQTTGIKTHVFFKIKIDLLYRRGVFCHECFYLALSY